MNTRFIVWHIPVLGTPLPKYYIDRDVEPRALRIYAGIAPSSTDLLVDILDDGVSIMNSNNRQKVTFKNEESYLEFNALSGTFTIGETITGGTSGATAKIDSKAVGHLTIYEVSGTFTVGETITGGTSAATAVVNAYVKQVKNSTKSQVAGQSRAMLPKDKSSSEAAQDFIPGVEIEEGSWLSLSVLEAAGANNITVQLEVEELKESEEQDNNRGN